MCSKLKGFILLNPENNRGKIISSEMQGEYRQTIFPLSPVSFHCVTGMPALSGLKYKGYLLYLEK